MKTGKLITKYRWWIMGFALTITLVFGLQIPKSQIDPNMDNYIPTKMESRINTNKIQEIFGGSDPMVIAFETKDVLNPETLKRVKKISKSLKKLDDVNKVLSLFDLKSIKGEDGAMIVDPAVPHIPKTPEGREKLRKELENNSMVYKKVVSEDFKMTAIIATVKKEVIEEEFMAKVNRIMEENPGSEKVYMGGIPYLTAIVSKDLSHDFKILLPVGIAIMLFMLYFFFRQKRGVLLPFLIVLMSIVFSMGLIPVLGWKLSIVTLLLPIILIAVANDYGIHLIARYQELFKDYGSEYAKKKLAEVTYSGLKLPIILTGLTTIVGILSLLSHRMIPARQIGVLAAAGITFALFFSLVLIPAILSLLKKKGPPVFNKKHKTDIMDRILKKFGLLVTNQPKKILIFALSLVILTGTGLIFLKVDTNIENFFPKHHAVRQGAKVINDNFGGSQNLSVLVEGDIKDPALLKRMEKYEESIKTHEGVGNIFSITDVVKEMSKAINDKGDSLYNKIPGTRNAVAQYFELYSMSGDPDDFEQLVDFDYQHALIMVTLKDASNTNVNGVIKYIRKLTKGDKNIKLIGGYTYISSQLAHLVVKGQMISLLLAMAAIIFLVMLIFRSVRIGLMSSVPLLLAIIFLFGLMGILGIRLDIATALLSSMMIGIGVDYTIHFLWRYKEEFHTSLNSSLAIRKTLETTGRGIVFNALSVIIGFSVLLISTFPPIRFFGFLVIISISACLIGALMIIPSLLIVFDVNVEPWKKIRSWKLFKNSGIQISLKREKHKPAY